MTENGDPYENALAERMNRTLKEEFGLGNVLRSKLHAKLLTEEAINLYNNYRPHLSLKMKTPESVYKQNPSYSRNWDYRKSVNLFQDDSLV
jgi:putative transposase